jgi:iron complex outermembrane receptor protein
MKGLTRIRNIDLRSLSLAAPLCLACYAAPAWAQTPEAPAQTAPDGLTSDIVVTAQKRSERLQDVPISITALSADTLKTAGAKQLSDIAAVTPGLQFQPSGSFSQPMIRGVGTSSIAPGFGSNVGIYVDGFLLPNPATTNFQLPNVTGIQVLKGPQGTLFGRNTTGGAILLTTADPSTKTSLQAQVSYASYNTVTMNGYGTTGLTDKIAADLSVQYERGDGFIRNIANGDNKAGNYNAFGLRAGLKFQLSDQLSVLLRYSHNVTNNARLVYHGVYCCNVDGKPFSSTAYVPGSIIATGPNEVSADKQLPGRTRVDAATMTINLDTDFAKITSYSQYRDETNFQGVDLDSSSIPAVTLRFPYNDKIFTQEFVFASNPGTAFQWTAGLYYFNDVSDGNTEVAPGNIPYFFLVEGHDRNTTYAGYVDATYAITDRLFLTGGVRVSHDVFDDAFVIHPGPSIQPVPSLSKTSVTPRAVIRFKPDDHSSLYVSYTEGYKSGGRTISNSDPTIEIKPEQIRAVEAGYKMARGPFSLNLSGYYYDYKNMQVSSYQNGISLIKNAATARIYGFEGDAHYSLSHAFQLDAGFAYTDAKYIAFDEAPFALQCTIAATPAACAGLATGSFVPPLLSQKNLRDSPMQYAPKFTGNVGARYTLPVLAGDLTLSGNLTYTSKMYFDPAAQFAEGGREKLDLRAEWVDGGGHYTIAVFAKNVTDRRYRVTAMFNTSAVVQNWNEPLSVGGSVGFKF